APALGSRARRADAGARLPGGDGLRPERARHQPQPGRAHRAGGRGGRRRRAARPAREVGDVSRRVLTVAAAQMGPVERGTPRAEVLERMVALLAEAAGRGVQLVVFPELALTPFFPRWLLPDEELEEHFDDEVPGPSTKALFDEARRLGVGVHLGYA